MHDGKKRKRLRDLQIELLAEFSGDAVGKRLVIMLFSPGKFPAASQVAAGTAVASRMRPFLITTAAHTSNGADISGCR